MKGTTKESLQVCAKYLDFWVPAFFFFKFASGMKFENFPLGYLSR